jgi:hypothetical protein
LEDLFKKDYSAKEKISRSKELYSFKLKLESEAQISEKAPDHIQEGIDSAALESEAQTYINNNLVSYKEPATTNIQVIEKKPLTIFQTLHKAFKLQKKLAYEKQGLKIPEHNPSWSIDKIQYIYTEKTTQNEMIPHNTKYVTKITSSFGHQIYIAIKDEIKEDKKFLTNESKFISASDHWAGGFFNKSGIKFLHHHNKVGGYEIKIMDNDARLFTKKTYINKEKDCLLIFDQIVGHTEISIDKPIEEILVDDFQTNLGGRDFSTDLIQ